MGTKTGNVTTIFIANKLQLEIQSTDSSLGKVLENILPYIRFPCMTADDLLKVVKPSGIVPLEDLFEAMTYHAAPNSLDTTKKKFFPRRFRKHSMLMIFFKKTYFR